jgi:hypothetical protein
MRTLFLIKKESRLKYWKTTGIDNIKNEMLEHGDPKLMEEILNCCENINITKKNTGNEKGKSITIPFIIV